LSWDTLADFDRDGESDWSEVVAVFEAAGYVWGGRFSSIKDNPHFEKTFGNNWRVLLDRYNKKDFLIGAGYVNL
jgi:peptidoglycan L-alanyl-D-glutamate endopeptidase CwlK